MSTATVEEPPRRGGGGAGEGGREAPCKNVRDARHQNSWVGSSRAPAVALNFQI